MYPTIAPQNSQIEDPQDLTKSATRSIERLIVEHVFGSVDPRALLARHYDDQASIGPSATHKEFPGFPDYKAIHMLILLSLYCLVQFRICLERTSSERSR